MSKRVGVAKLTTKTNMVDKIFVLRTAVCNTLIMSASLPDAEYKLFPRRTVETKMAAPTV